MTNVQPAQEVKTGMKNEVKESGKEPKIQCGIDTIKDIVRKDIIDVSIKVAVLDNDTVTNDTKKIAQTGTKESVAKEGVKDSIKEEAKTSIKNTTRISIKAVPRKPIKGRTRQSTSEGGQVISVALHAWKYRNLTQKAISKLLKPKPRRRPGHYFTAGKSVHKDGVRDVASEKTPFWFPTEDQLYTYRILNRVWMQRFRKKQMSYRYWNRPNFRSRQCSDILQRLYMSPDEDNNLVRSSILDIDPLFFRIIEGRLVTEKISIPEYISNVRRVLRTRIKTGYTEDQMLKFDEEISNEEQKISEIEYAQRKYAVLFEQYLQEDYKDAMEKVREADADARLTASRNDEYKRLYKQMSAIKREVYVLEEHWRTSKIYQRFIYQVSPMWWRKEHDKVNLKRSESSESVEEQAESSIFGRYRLASSGSIASLQSLIDIFLEDVKTQDEPQLYFTDPAELTSVFEAMELQNLNSLLHSEDLAIPLHDMQQDLEKVREKFGAEERVLQEKIDELDAAITIEESRANDLEERTKLVLNGVFKDMIASEEALSFYVFVQDAYENCIAPNDSNLGLRGMMKGIERGIEGILLQLDYMPERIVQKVESQNYLKEVKKMKDAEEAAFTVRAMDQLIYKLKKNLTPPPVKIGKPLVPRSEPPQIRKKPEAPPRELTKEETDYLNFFTDFCHHIDDPLHYLNSLRD